MPWVTPPPDTRTDEERKADEHRYLIRQAIPVGWALHFNRLTYGFEAAHTAGDIPIYGVCGHGSICLMAGHWRHPYPSNPICSKPPTLSHTGIW